MPTTKRHKTKKTLAKRKDTKKSFIVAAIGASAGGLKAVSDLLKNLSSTTGMAYIYVQHLSPDYKSSLERKWGAPTHEKINKLMCDVCKGRAKLLLYQLIEGIRGKILTCFKTFLSSKIS